MKTTITFLNGKPDAGNPHVRLDKWNAGIIR